MSVIAWDGKTLAADRQWTAHNHIRHTRKIWRNEHQLIGGIGNYTDVLRMYNWVLGGMLPEKFPDFPKAPGKCPHLWLITRAGVVKFEDSPFPMECRDKFFADGSGRDFAMGVMEMGGTSEDAVRVASKYDIYCGGGIDVFTLPE